MTLLLDRQDEPWVFRVSGKKLDQKFFFFFFFFFFLGDHLHVSFFPQDLACTIWQRDCFVLPQSSAKRNSCQWESVLVTFVLSQVI